MPSEGTKSKDTGKVRACVVGYSLEKVVSELRPRGEPAVA